MNMMESTYKITYWTQPNSFIGGEEKTEIIKARGWSNAVYKAEQKHKDWAILDIKEIR